MSVRTTVGECHRETVKMSNRKHAENHISTNALLLSAANIYNHTDKLGIFKITPKLGTT